MKRGALTGSRIRDRRVAAGMKQADLARAAGISPSYLNLIEHNRRAVGGKLLADLARTLGCELSALTEGAEAALLGALREAAAAPGGRLAETERAEEFAGRFPGWAELLAERHGRVERLEREVATLSDRLSHDPHLSAALHELLSAVTAIRATASILAGTDDLDSEWSARFLANLDAEGRRLADGATELVRHLDEPGEAEAAAATPQEEVESFFAARGWHLAEVETEAPPTPEAMVAAAPEFESAAGRALGVQAIRRYATDAARLPLEALSGMQGAPPGEIAARFGAPADAVLRRLALLPEREVGLVLADGAGAITFRRPIAGFGLPRHGAGCPLWPLYQALTRPSVPVSATVEMPDAGARRFRADAIATPIGPPDFSAPPVFETVMMLTPAPGEGPALPVGPACRICPRVGCRARREPSIISAA